MSICMEASTQPFSRVELVDPERAKLWLAKNFENNRSLNSTRIAGYAKEMAAGEWKIGEPLSFDVLGRLIDGQHRLHAVIEAGVAISFLVIYDVSLPAIPTFDLHQKRTVSQIANIDGIKFTRAKTATLRAMMIPCKAKTSGFRYRNHFSPRELIALYLELQEAIDFACARPGRLKNSIVNGVVARAFYGCDRDRLEEFKQSFSSGFGKSEEDTAAIALHHWFQNYRIRTSRIPPQEETYKKAQSALSAFLARQPRKLIKSSEGNLFYLATLDNPAKD